MRVLCLLSNGPTASEAIDLPADSKGIDFVGAVEPEEVLRVAPSVEVLLVDPAGASRGIELVRGLPPSTRPTVVVLTALTGRLADRASLEGYLRESDASALTGIIRGVARTASHPSRNWSHDFDELVGTCPAMVRLKKSLPEIARSSHPVLVSGETGTGKEIVAGLIHRLSGRPKIVAIDCAALTENLFESEMFGHERGAFTGAVLTRKGRLAEAGDGTLFLDELGNLSAANQAKLLRALESRTFRAVGAAEDQRFGARVVAASNANLKQSMREGSFRPDLYHRVSTLHIAVPPLRSRGDDIRTLLHHFSAQQPTKLQFSTAAEDYLLHYPWPGNVRQLKKIVDRLGCLQEGGVLQVDDVRAVLVDEDDDADSRRELVRAFAKSCPPGSRPHEEFQRMLFDDMLEETHGNVRAAARRLNVDRRSLRPPKPQ